MMSLQAVQPQVPSEGSPELSWEDVQALQSGVPALGLRPFRLGALLRGAKIYEFREFYRAKNVLLRYDHRRDYLNYGYWPAGAQTQNPSAELVIAVAERAQLGPDAVVLNVGSGLGQPDVDIMRHFRVRRIIGININAGQVDHANRRAKAAGLGDVIEHRVADAQAPAEALGDTRPTCAIAIESLAEMPDVEGVLKATCRALEPGGTLALCDVVLLDGGSTSTIARGLRLLLAKTTAALYGDSWRTVDAYVQAAYKAGFGDVRFHSIGREVYPPTFRFAKRQIRSLFTRRSLGEGGLRLRLGLVATVFAFLNLGALNALHALGCVDYVIICARKRAS